MTHTIAALLEKFVLLLYPAPLCAILFLTAFIFWKKKFSRFLLAIGLIYFYAATSGILPLLLVTNLEKNYQRVSDQAIQNNKAMIVLGAGLSHYPNEVNLGLIGSARILEAARIYHVAAKNNIQYTIFLTGGKVQSEKISEAELYKKWLLQLGVPEKNIVAENNSLNTFQNAQFTKKIIDKYSFDKVLLVTSAVHMRRSQTLFDKFNVDTVPAPSDFPYPRVGFLPFEYNLTVTHMALHEYFGLIQIKLYDFLGLNKVKSTIGHKPTL